MYHLRKGDAEATRQLILERHAERLAGVVDHSTVQFEPYKGWIAVFCVVMGTPVYGISGAEFKFKGNTKPAPTPVPKNSGTSTQSANAQTRPSKGATKLVWEIADRITGDGPIDRAVIIAACEAEGINKSTAGTQYSKWKRAREEV